MSPAADVDEKYQLSATYRNFNFRNSNGHLFLALLTQSAGTGEGPRVAGNLRNQHFNSIISDKLKNVFLKIFRSVIFCLAGLILLIIISKFQQVAPPKPGEYYYSSFLNNNYTILFGFVLFLVGLLIGYLLKYNPWLAGLSLILIYPVTSIYEATVFKGSHNLIPFEFFIFFAYSLPAVLGVYLGKYISRRIYATKQE